jgi:predicted dehydrogenase
MEIDLQTTCPMPDRPRPIIIIGAGGIVRDAHLPAYRLAGFEVAGIFDLDLTKAQALASDFAIPQVFASMAAAVEGAPADVIYDVAVPGGAVLDVIEALPDGSAVLIQKPLGRTLTEGRAIRAACQRKDLTAAVNFQLRYAPPFLALRDLLDSGRLGVIHDIQMQVTILTPWNLWDFLEQEERVEILYHSIHYLDAVRALVGDPSGVYSRVVGYADYAQLADVKSTTILDYGDALRVVVAANHCHRGGLRHQESYLRVEGDQGIVHLTLGLCLDYPRGQPDRLEVCFLEDGDEPAWQTVPIEGTWFPHAFIGTMASVMRAVEDSERGLPTSVHDALRTMALVEAAYTSSRSGATPIPYEE